MSEAVILAMIIGIPPTLVAFGNLIVSLRTREKTEHGIRQNETMLHKVDIVITKSDEIHALTNSSLSTAIADLAEANVRIGNLEEVIAQMLKSTIRKNDESER